MSHDHNRRTWWPYVTNSHLRVVSLGSSSWRQEAFFHSEVQVQMALEMDTTASSWHLSAGAISPQAVCSWAHWRGPQEHGLDARHKGRLKPMIGLESTGSFRWLLVCDGGVQMCVLWCCPPCSQKPWHFNCGSVRVSC